MSGELVRTMQGTDYRRIRACADWQRQVLTLVQCRPGTWVFAGNGSEAVMAGQKKGGDKKGGSAKKSAPKKSGSKKGGSRKSK